ncbi:MAG TPA: TetR/AcrR family transcriptional regulator [Solirubrobacteraceae bacterium]|jgi:AcrR family transcriptional regulator
MAVTEPTLKDAPAKAMRSDARENREKLLRAASERFGAGGPDVSLELIARTAGVGIGTLYRHFPTREALIEAVYRNEVDQLCDSAAVLLAELPPEAALAEWMERFVGYLTTKRGLLGALKSVAASQSDLFPTTRERLIVAIDELLQAGIAAGRVRPDVDAEDIMIAVNGVWTIAGVGEEWAARARRVMRLVLDGLRFGAGA